MGQAANRKGRAAMTRKTYCGNLLWQSGLTLLALGGHEPDLGKAAQEERWPEAERATKEWINKWNEHCKLKNDCKDKCVWEYVK